MNIVERLRDAAKQKFTQDAQIFQLTVCNEAADEIEELRKKFNITLNSNFRQMKEIDRLREVVMLLIAYDEHDKNTDKSEILWDVLIEAAHDVLKDKDD